MNSRNHPSLSIYSYTHQRSSFSFGQPATVESAEDSSLDLTNGHKVYPSGRLQITSWPKLLQFLSSKVEQPLATFVWDQTEAHRKRPQSCPQDLKKWFITLNSPPTNQFPAWPRTTNPWCLLSLPYIICSLHTIRELGFCKLAFHSPGWRHS